MPELPEVETVKNGLLRLIVGRKVVCINSDNHKSFPNSKPDVDNFLIGAKVINVRRRAKVLMIDLSSKYTLVIHLKMTGQLVFVNEHYGNRGSEMGDRKLESSIFNTQTPTLTREVRFGGGHPTDSLIKNLPDKSTRVEIEFEDSSRLYFNDQRKFGWMKLVPTIEVEDMDFIKKLGPEPLSPDFTPKQFAERFKRRSNTTIKAALLDQTVIAGVGNIYADESLWGAKIHPATRVGDLSYPELKLLYSEIRYVMNLSIEKGGSTNRNYVDAEGKKGKYMDFARVFRKEGQPCPRCGMEIIKIRVAGRGTHICPKEQKLSKPKI